ncbi:kinesin-like protein KIF23 isoform X1 [Branchiostoma floridae x Branchiostoma japonicum]
MKPTRGKTPKKTPRRPQQSNKPKDPVEVYCRLRPPNEEDVCAEVLSDGVLLLRPSEAARVNRIGELKETQHTFKFVFPPETSQKTLFDVVALPLVQDVIQGRNGLLFTYGITGSGKTHTVQGTPADHGLLPRCLDVIFNSIGELQAKRCVFKPDKVNGMDLQTEADAMLERQRKLQQDLLVPPKTPTTPRRNNVGDDWQNFPYVADPTKVDAVDEDNAYAVFVSFIEIYNNYIYDLLEEAPTSMPSTPRGPLKYQTDDGNGIAPQSKILREDMNHNMYVYGATEVEVKNPEEACEQLIKGQKRRRVAHTQLNMASSRSHSVFLIRVAQAPLDPEGEEVLQDKSQVCVSQLALVDLAGSERTNRTKNTGDRLREASNINASLMVLRTCIEILRENQTSSANRIVPYRDSKVTHLFKNYFEGEGKVRMVICVNPSASDYEETIHVMRFAELTQEVEITRQKEVRFDTGLTPGRRKANQMYREALEKFERGEQDANFMLPGRPGYSLGPPWPCLELTSASDSITLQTLIQYLVDREACRRTLCDDLSRKHEGMRSQLLDLEKNNIVLRQEMETLQEQLTGKGKDLERAKKKIENLEYKNEVLRRTAQLYDEEKKEMESELKSKEHQISSRTAESRRLRQTMKAIEQTKDAKWEKECDRRMKQQRMELQNKMWVKEEKLRQLKEIVSHKDGKRRAKSPPPKPTAPPVRLNHRRSRSASGDRWLDHKPVCNLDTETVLQPHLKKKMTVSVPDVKNIKKTDKYMLTHQEEDSQGEIETKLIKGDVFKSRGGGHSVQFTDIEVLKQEAPPESRKRSASEDIAEEHTGDWTDVEERCAIAVEGHDRRASAKRHKV